MAGWEGVATWVALVPLVVAMEEAVTRVAATRVAAELAEEAVTKVAAAAVANRADEMGPPAAMVVARTKAHRRRGNRYCRRSSGCTSSYICASRVVSMADVAAGGVAAATTVAG